MNDRQAFEAWYVKEHPKAVNPTDRHRYGYYMKPLVQAAWEAWSAQSAQLAAQSLLLSDKEGEIAKLREALEPFAAMAGEYDEHEDAGFEIWRDFSPLILALRITVGQARKARAALAAKESV